MGGNSDNFCIVRNKCYVREKPFFMVKQLSVWSGDLSNFTSQIWLISSRLSSFGAGQEEDGGRCQGGRGGDAAGLDHEQGE